MGELSKNLTGILNFLTALLSIPIIGAGIWLATKAHDTDCVRFLQYPVIAIGVFILLVSLAGMLGACCGIVWLLWVYLAVMFVLIILLFCFTVFAFVVTNKGAGDAVSGKGFREFHLGNYSKWLERHLVGQSSRWHKIRSCLADSKVCEKLDDKYISLDDFDHADLSPTESGCCKPPSSCGFTFQSPTNWTKVATTSTDADCTRWSNDQSQLCFDCDSCKAGVLENVKKDWRKVAIVNVVMLVILIIVYTIGCSAMRTVRRDKYQYGYA